MAEINKRAAYIHIDVPGQEDDAPDLPAEYDHYIFLILFLPHLLYKTFTFPSMQSLGEDLVCVLDQLSVKHVICIGEGAGANIVARFAIAQPERVLGLCLIHCTGTTAGFMESLRDKLIGWKLEHIGMNPTAESYLMLHRFGSVDKAENKEQWNKVIENFKESLRKRINPHNLNRFVKSFMKRTNIADSADKIKSPTLVVTGTLASFNHSTHTLIGHLLGKMDKTKVDILEIEGVANVLEEKPDRLAESFLYFCQGLGIIGGVPMPRMQQRTSSIDSPDPDAQQLTRRTRSMSMEEADKPLGIYSTSPKNPSSLSTSPTRNLSSSPPAN
ncbi:hypothetical protein FSP39_008663 [Pinctada imbricata]|uniref:Uncharacterized protein n=1 Tax=Pinctada imbricata TaxID=66713 RepID=A0AA88Y2Z7_PINIB|nr:hypothetical protein FSP39_008663 [Pinctada imbricata]